MGDDRYAPIAGLIRAMPAQGGDPGEIARLIDGNRDPELFWAICDWGTSTPWPPALQAMLEILFHPEIELHPHAVGETLDQLFYHAPVFMVDAYLDRMEWLIAEAPARAPDCWWDLTATLQERMTAAGRDDLAARIAPIDDAVERILEDEDRHAMHAVFRRFDPIAAGDWNWSDLDAAMKALAECSAWWDLLPECLAELEPRRAGAFWCAVLMRAMASHVRCFDTMPDETVGEWITDALGQNDERPLGDAARAALAVLASRFAPGMNDRFGDAARAAGDRLGVDFARAGVPADAPTYWSMLRRLVRRADHYAKPRDERLDVPQDLRGTAVFGHAADAARARPPKATRAETDAVLAALMSGAKRPAIAAEASAWWRDWSFRGAVLTAIARALSEGRVKEPGPVGMVILHGLAGEDDPTLVNAARAAAAYLRHGDDPAWKNRLWQAGHETRDRRPFARGDLHAALSDLLWDARSPNGGAERPK
ncbi:hypothetical protein [Oricola sp.]|uniref:hypothetical protein n=1 Tax=Oricola sp. TaxID=1979950 RepID=UPI0025F6FD4D|nr:hypothetical protein [Oricola sp.]MCI5077753.1 hypothetical protein [Oricola sp.]